MNLVKLFSSLEAPSQDTSTAFIAKKIPDYERFRLAKSSEGFPILLISVPNALHNSSLQNYRFKYLQIVHNLECKVTENCNSHKEILSVVTFRSTDTILQKYFMKVSEPLVKSLGKSPTQEQIEEIFLKFVDIFRTLSEPSKRSIQGLWAELLLIFSAKSPEILLDYWHEEPSERFDFNSGRYKIEVKSSSNFSRNHSFSLEQLSPPEGKMVLVASIFTRPSDVGVNIFDLVNKISSRVNNIDLIGKLFKLVSSTLGRSIDEASELKYDLNTALNSINFYSHQQIKKIDIINIPPEVTEIRFKSDLSSVEPINPRCLISESILFKALL